MEENLQLVENIFLRSDFSKESELKNKLERRLFPVKEVTLDQLMEKEGIVKRNPERDEQIQKAKELRAEKHAEMQGRGRNLNGKEPDSLGAIERENPLIKKGKPPVL